MDWKTLNAGKKTAEKLAPDPAEHTPEAPVISEEEAQAVENPSGQTPQKAPEEIAPDDVRKHTGHGNADPDGIRITPEDNDK